MSAKASKNVGLVAASAVELRSAEADPFARDQEQLNTLANQRTIAACRCLEAIPVGLAKISANNTLPNLSTECGRWRFKFRGASICRPM